MAVKNPRAKRSAVSFPVPQSRDEANTAIRLIGIDQRELARIEADMNDEIAALREKYETTAQPLRDAITARIDGLQMWAEANRASLTRDGKVKSAAPYHPAFKSFIQSGAFVKWKPSTYDVQTIAGRVFTDGQQQFAGQRWSYDLTFSAPITLHPAARTVPPR